MVGPDALCGMCKSAGGFRGGIAGFATTLTIHAYDTNENPLATVAGVPCSCLSETRLSVVVPAAATQSTYLEIEGFAPPNAGAGTDAGIFTGSWQLQVTTGGLNLFVSQRLHNAPVKALLTGGF